MPKLVECLCKVKGFFFFFLENQIQAKKYKAAKDDEKKELRTRWDDISGSYRESLPDLSDGSDKEGWGLDNRNSCGKRGEM